MLDIEIARGEPRTSTILPTRPTRVDTHHSAEGASAQVGAVHLVGIGPNIEEATEDAARRAVDFAVAQTGLSREEAYMLLSIVGELRVGTSPRPVMATRLIVPEEPLRAAGWNGDLP